MIGQNQSQRRSSPPTPAESPPTVRLPERTHHSWWRHPAIGYLSALPIVGASIGVTLLGESLLHDYYLPTSFLFVALLLVALCWGTGPAVFILLVSDAILSFLALFPGISHTETPLVWDLLFEFLPFILASVVVVVLTSQRERARQRAIHAEQLVRERAQELTTMNQELKQADKLKDQFLSTVSHELRTPVTSIRGYVQLLLRQMKRQSAQNSELLPVCDSLGKVDEQTRRFTDLVNDLLDINTLRSGKMPVRPVSCDLRGLCQKAVEEQQALTGRSVDLRLPAAPLVVQVDEGRFSQVVSNLVTNALKYSLANTVIRVEISQKPGEAIVAVHNERPLLSKEQQETIFEPFYRCHEAQSAATPGWGLGLAISKGIVAQHSGRIWVESSEEKGTTFFVALPFQAVFQAG